MTQPESTDPAWIDPDRVELSAEERISSSLEAPEADAAEQLQPVRPELDVTPPSRSFEVNEADAAEQARIVLEDDEYDR